MDIVVLFLYSSDTLIQRSSSGQSDYLFTKRVQKNSKKYNFVRKQNVSVIVIHLTLYYVLLHLSVIDANTQMSRAIDNQYFFRVH